MTNFKNKSVRSIKQKADAGDIKASFQLSEYYRLGRYVDTDQELAKKYANKALELFKGHALQVSAIKLINFRAFQSVDLHLCHANVDDENITVIVGKNGAGKTALLEAIKKSLSWIRRRIVSQGGNGELVDFSDINVGAEYTSIVTYFSIKKGLQYSLELSKAVEGSNSSRKNSLLEVTQLADVFKLANSEQEEFNFPIMAYYSVERSSDINAHDIDRFNDVTGEQGWSKFEGYSKSLNGTADFNLFFRWFKDVDDINNAKTDPNEKTLLEIEKLKAQIDGTLFDDLVADGESGEKLKRSIGLFKKKTQVSIKILQDSLVKNETSDYAKALQAVSEAIYSFMPGFSNIRVQRSPTLDMLVEKNKRL